MPLPGEEAHFIMEPAMRKKWRDLDKIKAQNPKQAGVMALFYPKQEVTHVLMILRKRYEGVHSNQIGFPGGKEEKDDKNLLITSLRETEEEVGVKQNEVQVVKELTKLYIPPSNFWVQPYMGLYESPKPFIKQESEVEDLVEIPLHQILDDAFLIEQKLSTSYAKNVNVPAFSFNGHIVWGATAMMLNEIRTLLKRLH